MNKLISKYSHEHNDIIVVCSCGGSDHHLRISQWKDDAKTFLVSIVPASFSFWTRVQFAWDMLCRGPHHDEVIIDEDQMKELVETLKELVNQKNKIHGIALNKPSKVPSLIKVVNQKNKPLPPKRPKGSIIKEWK